MLETGKPDLYPSWRDAGTRYEKDCRIYAASINAKAFQKTKIAGILTKDSGFFILDYLFCIMPAVKTGAVPAANLLFYTPSYMVYDMGYKTEDLQQELRQFLQLA